MEVKYGVFIMRPKRFRLIDDQNNNKATHYLFRYPAKFHPPIARSLIEAHTEEGDIVLDPFCGSGTLSVEAALLGRSSIGIDIDPVAVFVSKVKTRRLDLNRLFKAWSSTKTLLHEMSRPSAEYTRRQFVDISPNTLKRLIRKEQLWVPDIPKIEHWFRNYVIVDLARILKTIESLDIPRAHVDFLRLCFAASIRNSSNADPVPVSGLEVTRHMRQKDREGRIVNPYQIFGRIVERNLSALDEFCAQSSPKVFSQFFQADATEFTEHFVVNADAVITSPPYHSAVDYYRRHTLEMYWLRHTKDHARRLDLLPRYIGRSRVRVGHNFVSENELMTRQVRAWERKLRGECETRANAFKHYVVAMQKTFEQIAGVLVRSAPAIFVVGHSRWGHESISTSKLFTEIASPWFDLKERYWYPIKNRYMSYSRHNGANIDREHVLVFKRT
jgi:tRNA G10  N-methylase Trm11